MLGLPLPAGATLVERRPGAGTDSIEVYAIEASEDEIEGFFKSALPRDGWTADSNVPGFWSKGPHVVMISIGEGRFSMGGS